MSTRRSHHKSRQGCTSCKRRHVKCDEGGPPCGQCKVRATHCEYAGPPRPSPSDSTTSRNTAESDVTNTNSSSSSNSNSHPKSISIAAAIADWQVDEPIFPPDRRLLELQLMSRWSAITYKSFVTKIAGDDHVWLRKLPELSLQHDFLLHGIFALAALEIASASERDRTRYIDVAHEYQDSAISTFRAHLLRASRDTLEATLLFSMMLMVLAIASPQFRTVSHPRDGETMVQSAVQHHGLVRGCEAVLLGNEDYITQNPYMSRLASFDDLASTPLDALTEAAMTKLHGINEQRLAASMADSYERRIQQLSFWKGCKSAIDKLRQSFEKCFGDGYDGYALAWLNLSGEDYVTAISAGDPVALMVLMYWGVLIERLGRHVWWARNYGKLLIEEIIARGEIVGVDESASASDIIVDAQTLLRR